MRLFTKLLNCQYSRKYKAYFERCLTIWLVIAISYFISKHIFKFSTSYAERNDYPSNGYKRADFLRSACRKYGFIQNKGYVRVSYSPKHNVFYCPLCKMASTFWTRVFKMMELNGIQQKRNTPFDVSIAEAPASDQFLNINSQHITPNNYNAKYSFRFIVVRNPFGLLFSAFVDKIVGPNPELWTILGKPAIDISRRIDNSSCGDDVSYEEFLRYIVHIDKQKQQLDCHIAKFDACLPCSTNYTFIVKMETFKEDTFHILSKLDQTHTLDIFWENFTDLHANDAIDDSVSGPFSWKDDIVKCISWPKALQRIWRKLQIRGVIGSDAFPLSEAEAETINKEKFIEMLKAARKYISPAENAWQKKQAYMEAYKSIPVELLDEIRHIYKKEFSLFDYDDQPANLFDTRGRFKSYGFMNYSNIITDINE